GDVHLWLPLAQQCTVDWRSISGSLHCDLPHELESHGRGRAEARVNGGGVKVRIHTTSGNARFTPWGEEAPGAEPAEEQPFRSRDTRPLAEEMAEAEPFSLDEEPVAQASDEAQGEVSPATRRMQILKDIEAGKLTVSEGLAQLREIG
ncbi:MAG: hypothetical protein H5T69_20390, partial [Chloroflexi bacterium]|nr:hypothetical protein [Chloroflexota bacterium]